MPTIKNLLPGSPEPLGATVKPDGVNFALHSQGATRVDLLLFDNVTDTKPSQASPPLRVVTEVVSDLRAAVDAHERAILEDTLSRCRFNQRDAARALSLSYDQLRHCLRRHGLLEKKAAI